jgi:5-methylcytosine-specific restriction endonuclease McrA
MAKKQPSWRGDKRSSSERGYTWAWTKARNAYLRVHPLCVMCQAMKPPRVTLANVVDHVIPHQGNEVLMWDESNWQALCAPHHNSDKQMLEKSGEKRTAFDADGRVVW